MLLRNLIYRYITYLTQSPPQPSAIKDGCGAKNHQILLHSCFVEVCRSSTNSGLLALASHMPLTDPGTLLTAYGTFLPLSPLIITPQSGVRLTRPASFIFVVPRSCAFHPNSLVLHVSPGWTCFGSMPTGCFIGGSSLSVNDWIRHSIDIVTTPESSGFSC